MGNLRYYIWLSLCFSYGSDKPGEMIDIFGGAEAIYEKRNEKIIELEFLTESDVRRIRETAIEAADAIIDNCNELGISAVSIDDKLYPQRLKLIYGPPIVIYYKGDISGIDLDVAIGVVGTRNPAEYSMQITKWICKDLALANVIVVSGCAVGIDAAAHFGALRGKGRTIAVLGCGVDVDYPNKNALLKEEIIKRGGAIISELPPGAGVRGEYFPVRNRIIAGLSLGVLVTQAPIRSGSLITAEHALEQGKEVYCVPPYNIMSNSCMGVMKYIRSGSTVVASAEDILLDFYFLYSDRLNKNDLIGDYVAQLKLDQKEMASDSLQAAVFDSGKEPKRVGLKRVEKAKSDENAEENKRLLQLKIDGLDEELKKICEFIGSGEKYAEEIATELNMSAPKVLAALTRLEMSGIIVPKGARRFMVKNDIN